MHLHLGVALTHHVEEEGVSIIVQRLRRNQTQSSEKPRRSFFVKQCKTDS
jgi:hypothetical protein